MATSVASSSARPPRRTSQSLPSREPPSPLVAASASIATTLPPRMAATVAAWEADAIEPDVSSRGSFYTSNQSSTSTDGESSECSSHHRRFGGLRVSLRRRRKSSFQYHVPLHLLARRRPSSRGTRPSDDDVGVPSFSSSSSIPDSATMSPIHVTNHVPKDPRRRASAAPCASPNMATTGPTRWRFSSSSRGLSSFVPATATATATHSVLERSGGDDPFDATGESFLSSSFSSSSSSSRRHRAWAKLKAHAKLPQIKRTTKTPPASMFSISFYPWKMEAHGYYSTPEAAVEWVPDTASTQCQLCSTSFNLARRRHHCRLCGRLVCDECSLQRTFLPIAEDAVRRAAHRSLIKSGEPQRTCDSCATTLKHMVTQHDDRVKEVCVGVGVGVDAHAQANTHTTSHLDRSVHPRPSIHQSIDASELQLVRPRGMSKASLARNDELDLVLLARAKSRVSGVGTRQHIISSLWLEAWLQFVQMDSSDAVSTSTYGHSYGHSSSHLTRPSMSSRSSMGMGMRRRSSRFAFGRRPGPVANYELLDFVNGKLVPRDGLRRSRGTEGTGDYHVVSHHVWRVFMRLYGGGPCITVDEDAFPISHRHHAMIEDSAMTCEGDGGFVSPPPRPLQWIIMELEDAAVYRTSDGGNDLRKSAQQERPSRVQPTSTTQPPLASRSTPVYGSETGKSSTRRPVSTTAIAAPLLPPTLARATSESHDLMLGHNTSHNDTHGRRKSLPFIGYLKKWRHGDDTSRPSGASMTFSQLDDDGVVLFDPTNMRSKHDRGIEGSHGPDHQHEAVGAVSAFASAAAAARRKSTMSLMRHSPAALTTHATSHSTILTA